MAELLAPNRKDIRAIFETEFRPMTTVPVTVEDLEKTRQRLFDQIHSDLTGDEKSFLISFKSKAPAWELLEFSSIDKLPAVRWKMMNLHKMSADRHAAALAALLKALRVD